MAKYTYHLYGIILTEQFDVNRYIYIESVNSEAAAQQRVRELTDPGTYTDVVIRQALASLNIAPPKYMDQYGIKVVDPGT